jgi:DNA-binding LacI/PurR family transcriptional regulator
VKVKSVDQPPRTLKELALLLGVSRATVSNAFNRPDQLSGELRERILNAAKEAGYVGPDPTARALSRGTRGAVGLIFTEQLSYAFSDPAAVHILEGVAQACEEDEIGLLLVPLSSENQGSTARAINSASVDGLILYSVSDQDPAVKLALARNMPTVMVDQPMIRGIPYVGHDHRGAARLALSHLLDLGHRDVAVLAYRLTPVRKHGEVTALDQVAAGYYHTRARMQGYQDALDSFSLGWENLCFYESESNDPTGGMSSTAEILQRPSRPTAILADSDQLAVGALQVAAEHGIDVPETLSVIGMDDVPAAQMVTPALTTIRQPMVEKGRAAGRILLGKGPSRKKIVFPVELVVRDSTGPAPQRQKRR